MTPTTDDGTRVEAAPSGAARIGTARSGAAPTVRLDAGRWVVDGTARLVGSGEVHYFRVARDDWAARLDDLVAAGATCVATYVPWLVHELPDGSFDLTGDSRPDLDLQAFLDLAGERGLGVLARPGPFVMGELKNEGLPYRLFTDHPEIVPPSFGGRPSPVTSVDVASPAYLAEVRRWYAAVMPLLARNLWTTGGPVVAVQLDNEVGMLPWVTNSPDLSDAALADLVAWLRVTHPPDVLARRYPVDLGDTTARAVFFRDPPPEWGVRVMRDLGASCRERYRRYVATLAGWARRDGVVGVPFLVNVHGSEAGSARPFGVGISQLSRTWEGVDQLTAGSDLYLGDLTVGNVADVWLAHAFLAATLGPDQPVTALEFEVGSGDYAEDGSSLTPPEAPVLRARLLAAQGVRLVNEYLFSGGQNAALPVPVGDGNDLIALTGERHGFAAPVDPEGRRSPGWSGAVGTFDVLRDLAHDVAGGTPEHDEMVVGLVRDHWLTEYRPPGARVADVVADLERFRGSGARGVLGRALVFGGWSGRALDLQSGAGDRRSAAPDPASTPSLALASARHLDTDVQHRLADWVLAGGRLLLTGALPTHDADDEPCTVLADALGLAVTGEVSDGPTRFPAVTREGWAGPGAGFQVPFAQVLEPTGDAGRVDPLLRLHDGGLCAVQVSAGAGRAVVVAADVPLDRRLFGGALRALDAVPRHQLSGTDLGVVVAATVVHDDEGPTDRRVLHLVNVLPTAVDIGVTRDGVPLFGGATLHLPARTGRSERLVV